MGKIGQSVCRMCYGRYIPGVNEGACSISGSGLKDLEGPMDSWYTKPGVAQETSHVRSILQRPESLTFGEKCRSLIIRFLHHRSS